MKSLLVTMAIFDDINHLQKLISKIQFQIVKNIILDIWNRIFTSTILQGYVIPLQAISTFNRSQDMNLWYQEFMFLQVKM